MYIEIEDMARYISKRTGCSFDDGMDYQYSQRDYFDSLGLIIWDIKSEIPLERPNVTVDSDEMCRFIADDMGVRLDLCKRMAMAELEYLCVCGLTAAKPLDDLDLLIWSLDKKQRKEALAAIEVILSA